MKKKILFIAGMLMLFSSTQANDIAVSNVKVTDITREGKFCLVNFDLSWKNSWRTNTGPSNWDAAWVFAKFRVGDSDPVFTGVSSSGTTITLPTPGKTTLDLRVGMPIRVTSGSGTFAANTVITGITSATQFTVSVNPTTALSGASIECIRIWEHATLNNAGHTAASGSTIDVPADGTGAFIYRSANGSGTITFNETKLRWNYGANGVSDNANVNIRVFAIEMVYVPGGSFQVGDGATSFVNGQFRNGSTNTPFTISSEGELTLGGTANGSLANNNASAMNNGFLDDFNNSTTQTLPAAFPKGYNAFYSMKYEISQGQYRDFLNTLTYAQQVNRTETAPTSAAGTGALSSTNLNRNGIDIQTSGDATTLVPAVYGCNLNGNTSYNEAADGEWIACNFLSWSDGAAYLDWAGLRPMTELEYEKACRGTLPALAGEFAWGHNTFTNATSITNSGQATEVANAAANSVSSGNVQGPMRVGAFATASTTRGQAGATYYGIMEMSGNLWERVVTVGNPTGRAYTGTHGDGSLSTIGNANTTAWPGLVSGEITLATGSGSRGGDWSNASNGVRMRVSDRNDAATDDVANRRINRGLRGVRSAQ